MQLINTNQILLSLIPSVSNYAASGYTLPLRGIWSPTGVGLLSSQSTPSFTLASMGSISTILGFATGTYASSITVSQSLSSTLTHVGSTVNALVLRCNLVSNNVAVPSDVLDLVPINSTFGNNITYNPQSRSGSNFVMVFTTLLYLPLMINFLML